VTMEQHDYTILTAAANALMGEVSGLLSDVHVEPDYELAATCTLAATAINKAMGELLAREIRGGES